MVSEDVSILVTLLFADVVAARTAGEAVRDFLQRIGAAATLRELGLARDRLREVAEIGFKTRRLMNGSPRATSLEDLYVVVERAYEGTT